jgi:arabinogalactan oligomer / maltooligosaccharide transport system permease protein
MSQSLSRLIGAIILGVGLMLFGSLSLIGQAQADRHSQASQAQALYQAQALARLTVTARQNGSDDAALKTAWDDVLKKFSQDGDISRLIDREGKRLVYSSLPTDGAAALLPRRLTTGEKPLYDLILGLPVAGGTLGADDKTARAGAPILTDGQRTGAIEVALKTQAVSEAGVLRPINWAILALGMMMVALICVFKPALRAWGSVAIVVIGALILGMSIPAGANVFEAGVTQSVAAKAATVNEAVNATIESKGWALSSASPNFASVPKAAATGPKLDGASLRNSIFAMGFLAALLAAFIGFGGAAATGRAFKDNPTAYVYVGPALLGMLALAFFPFFYGFMLSFTDTTLLNQGASWGERWVGLSNYFTILNDFKFGGSGSAFNYQNFYWTLGVTILWTVTNVVLGVSIGLAMALLLNIKGLKGVAVYRTLLILPWAIPNYITALTWKGMFHPQFGAINQAIQAFGGQPVQWFDSFGPSFITGLATNAWLSFPFMMVVALGALQAVDEDMYEAARIDGASPWQQFWHITLPSLRPALLPAVIVSVVWTFNMFNVIYLVSAGQPSGSTEILVTRAYKIAFEEYRYGYAAAYSVVIFMILLVYGVFQIKATAATEANNK